MKKGIVARKLGMTQVFTETGVVVPVTVLEAGPCVVVQKKTAENDGYNAVQIGFGDVKEKHVNKPMKGHFDKASAAARKMLKEFKFDNAAEYEVGAEIKADIFAEGDRVDISGVSKGKGFQGSIKRHNQGRGPMSHGSKSHRVSGSMGSSASPSRVMKNTKLPGQMGNKNVTVQNLLVVRADAEKNLLLVRGAVPGPKGKVVVIKESVKS